MSKEMFKKIFQDFKPELDIIFHKKYITIANKERTFMRSYIIKK